MSTILYLCFFRCVSRFFRDISVSEIVFYLHIWFAVYIGQSLSVQTFRLAFAPKWGLTGTDRCTCFGGGGKSFSPPQRVLPGLLGFVRPRFRSSFEIWFTKENKGGGKTTFDSPFFQGCAFSFSFLLMSVLSELWPITIATSYIVNLLIRIFLGTKCFSIFYTTCVSWLLFRPCSGLPHVPLSFWNQSPFYRVHLHLRLSIIYLRFQVLIPSFRGISVSEIRFYLYIYLDLFLLANYTKHCP